MTISVLIVDDHKLMRQGLVSMLEEDEQFHVVGEADSGRQAVAMARELKPDVIVLDIDMKDLNGIDAAKQILSTRPEIRILALTMHSDQQYITGMLDVGAMGFLPKDSAFEELTRAIQCVSRGDMYLSPSVTGIVLKDYKDRSEKRMRGQHSQLTGREREVLQLVAEGLSSKEIASHLDISLNTVIRHRQNIMETLGIRSIAGLTKYAIRQGLTPLE
jgi:two-component system, NarL family, response regulator NreC